MQFIRSSAVIACAVCVGTALGQSGVRLTDGDATFDYNFGLALPAVSNGAGGNVPMNLQMSGAPLAPGTNWMPSGNWFYRLTGDSRERHFTNSGGTTMFTGSNEVKYTFPTVFSGPTAAGSPVADVTAFMEFKVEDTGTDKARLTTQVCFMNTGPAALSVDTFFAIDLDLDSTPLGDVYQPLAFGPRSWTATDGLNVMRMVGPGAIGAAVGNAATVIGNMTDGGIDNFPDVNAAGFPGTIDSYAALQFRGDLIPFQLYCCSLTVDIERIPEPGTLALLPLAVACFARRRR